MRAATLLGCFLLPALGAKGASMDLTVVEPSGVERKGWPVTSGVPFAKGALPDPGAVALFGPDSKEMPLQTEVLAKWPGGSVRWLLLDFQVDLAAREKRAFTLRYGPGVERAAVEKPIAVRRDPLGLAVESGPLQFRIEPDRFALLYGVRLDLDGDGDCVRENRLTGWFSPTIKVVDARSRTYTCEHRAAGPPQVTVEQAGPMRACVRVEGRHASDDGQMLRYVVRVHAFRGQPFVRFFYTFINDHQDSLMATVSQISLAFEPAHAVIGEHEELKPKLRMVLDGASSSGGTVSQYDAAHTSVAGKKRVGGWAAIGSERAGFAVGLREFWQNWPKSIRVDKGGIEVGLCSPHGFVSDSLEAQNKLFFWLRNGGHTFKVGLAKTHELWASFFQGPPHVERLAAFFQAAEEPLVATCEPAYVSATKAAGEFPPADPQRFAGYDAWLSRALDAHLARREKDREFGMLNYGDWFGERKVNWGNLEYDLQHGLFLQYLRTGDRRFFARAEQAARHHIDVDVVHATNPHLKNPWGRPPEAGDIWLHCLNHTGGYYDEKTSGLPVDRTYHMGHSTNYGHVWISGDLDYYYLTGDRRAREVALMVADTMARHCPTAYSDHIRGLGWPLILVLAAYDATCDKKYLDAATKCWEMLKKNFDWQKGWVVRLAKGHCLHDDRRCYGNVPFMEGLTLCGLARYHRVTGDPEVLKAITVGIDQTIRECWIEDVKAFRYTPCPLTKPTPYTTLAAEAMAYEAALTGNQEHLRILREGLRAVFGKSGADFGKGLAQLIHFTPHALRALEE